MRAPAPQAFASLSDQASRPEARPIYVQAAEPHRRYGMHTGTVADSHKRRHERDDARASEGEWGAVVGIDAAEALASALDDRGWHERRLQASLWQLCDDRLREAHYLNEPSPQLLAQEMLPPFEPSGLPQWEKPEPTAAMPGVMRGTGGGSARGAAGGTGGGGGGSSSGGGGCSGGGCSGGGSSSGGGDRGRAKMTGGGRGRLYEVERITDARGAGAKKEYVGP